LRVADLALLRRVQTKNSTFLSSLYIPSITNRLEQVLLVKELNQTLFNKSLEEKRLTQALTAPSTGGEADYERLEYIGSSRSSSSSLLRLLD